MLGLIPGGITVRTSYTRTSLAAYGSAMIWGWYVGRKVIVEKFKKFRVGAALALGWPALT